MSQLPVDILTYFPFVRQANCFTDADASGSLAVHHDLVSWALSEEIASSVSILPERLNVFSRERPVQVILDAIRRLPTDLRAKVSVRSSLSVEGMGGRLLALGKSSEFVELAAMRRATGRRIPVCGIVHACLFPGALATYMLALLASEPGDVLCATSEAAFRATTALLDQASDQFREWLAPSQMALRRETLKVVELPLAIDDRWLEPIDRDLARRILRTKQDRFEILCFGRVSREYKADLAPLLLAFRNLLGIRPDSVLVVAGSHVHTSADDYVRTLAYQHGVLDRVEIHSDVTPAVKKLMFSSANVFVAPSDNVVESFGLTLLEAMGAGLPVVASNWSGYRDLIKDGECGFLIDTYVGAGMWKEASVLAEFATTPHAEYLVAQQTILDADELADRLRMLATDSELCKELGECGRRRVDSTYVWSKVVHRFGDLWAEAVATASEAPLDPYRPPSLDLRRVFQHYPSSVLAPNATRIVRVSPLADDELVNRTPMDKPTWALLEACRESPRLFSYLASGDSEQNRRLFWLLKRGLLTLAHAHRPYTRPALEPVGVQTKA